MRLLSSLALIFLLGEANASYLDFGIPPSTATVDVRAFNVVNGTLVNELHASIFNPVLPGREAISFPFLAFLVEHKPSQKRLMFDLGIRSDPLNFAPSIAALFTEGVIRVDSPPGRDIIQLLQAGGIALNSISAVVWSHAHLDHIGDMSKFPNTTSLVIGSETDTSTYPQFPNASLLESDFAGREVTKLDFAAANLSFSGLKAIDYFGDGSFYLLNTPGHLPGHLTALARVTPTSFISLGGDTFHHPGEARPRPDFQKMYPCPAHLLEETKSSISTDYFWSPKSRDGVFDLRSRAQQFLAPSDLPGAFIADAEQAEVSGDKLATFDADGDFFMIVSHDISLREEIPYFPDSLNNWKANGLKERVVWNFVDKANPAFIFSPVNETQSLQG
ncbi:beta-lactamase-like protein [Mycena metata]|uniref:Beta-lactamase-like protein n=1 Tax=Mycena metata TaxID=1033252 RepID=A0AAD7K5P6_9AGAR|nr:beta-lactamase-like protein [Mycena metata]